MKKTLLVIISLGFFLAVSAQEEEPKESFKNEIGIHAGFTTGVGLSYRHWFGDNGFQLTFVPVKADYITWISGGLTFMHMFHESKYVRVYGYLGNHVYYYRDEYEDWIYDYDTDDGYYETVEDVTTAYNIGFGPGFSFGRAVQFNIQAGYGLYDVTGSFNMLPTAEMGLYYRF